MLEGERVTEFAWRFTFDVSYRGTGSLEDHLEVVMTELQALGADEPSIDAELATGSVSIELVTAANNFASAISMALVLIRMAVHAAGGATHDFVGEILVDDSEVLWEQSGLTSELVSA